MSNVTSTFRITGQLEAATTPTIYNVSTTASIETSQALSSDTKVFTIQARDPLAKLQLAFASGGSGTTFLTVRKGVSYTVELIKFTGTLYFQTTTSTIVEIVEWA